MKTKLVNFFKDYGWSLILALLGIAGVGWIVSLAGQIAEMAAGYAAPFTICMVSAFVLGLLASFLMGVNKRRMRRLEERLEKEKAEREEREAAAEILQFLVNMPPLHKKMLKKVYRGGGTFCCHHMDASIGYLEAYGIVQATSPKGLTTATTYTMTPKALASVKEHEGEIW